MLEDSDDEYVPEASRPDGRRKRAQSSGGASASSEGPAGVSSEDEDMVDIAYVGAEEERAREAAERALLLEFASTLLEDVVARLNAYLRQRGYPNLWQNRVTEVVAYYKCGCNARSMGCFNVTIERPRIGVQGHKHAASWRIKTMPDKPLCEPQEPMVQALSSTFIPVELKEEIVRLFDEGKRTAEAHAAITRMAVAKGLSVTWTKETVKNFIRNLERSCNDKLLELPDAATLAGHCVALDYNALYRRYGSCCLLDSTYGKNNLAMPFQGFVGMTSERAIVLFGVASVRSETRADFEWLISQFYACYESLSPTWITDGDAKIYDAIKSVAVEHKCDKGLNLLLCVWHLFRNVERNLAAKGVSFDPVELKRQFYSCRKSTSASVFSERWDAFIKDFGKTESALKYLQSEIFPLREKWCAAWTNSAFHAMLMSTSPSESFHSLLASGSSAHRTHGELLKRVDAVLVAQVDFHQQRCAKWDLALKDLDTLALPGLVLPSVVRLLSNVAWTALRDLEDEASRLRVTLVPVSSALYKRAWSAVNVLYEKALIHHVSEVDTPAPDRSVTAQRITGALSRPGTADEGTCALCGLVEAPSPSGFVLPPRWKKLFSKRVARIRLCRALGFGEPHEDTGPSNSNLASVTHVLEVYEEQLATLCKIMDGADARKAAMLFMQSYKMEGTAEVLGAAPVRRADCWLYCGLIGDETELPDEHKRDYCGKVFHFECCGMLRMPPAKKSSERIACLHCLSDARFRAKSAAGDRLIEQVMHRADGVPRIIPTENAGGRIPVLTLLHCDCKVAIGTGLPCAGMLAVARQRQAVLSYRHFHPHWFSHVIVDYEKPSALIEGNQHAVMDLEAVIANQVPHEKPSTLEAGVPAPSGVALRKTRGSRAVQAVITASAPGGRPVEGRGRAAEPAPRSIKSAGVQLPTTTGKDKSSRRKKGKKIQGSTQ